MDYNATIDYQRYVEYKECIRTTFNKTQFDDDFEAIMTNINSTKPEYATIQATLQKYGIISLQVSLFSFIDARD